MRQIFIFLGIGIFVSIAGTVFADPLDEVPRDHRSYQMIRSLHERGLVKSLPRGVLKEGSRPLTRYEMAVLVSSIVKEVKARMKLAMEQIAPKKGASPAEESDEPSGITQEDLVMLRSLQVEFSKDLDSPVKKQEEATALKDLEKIVKQHTIKGYFQVRALADQSSQRAGTAGDIFGADNAKNNKNRDTFFLRRARIQLGGKLTDHASYQIDWDVAGPLSSNERNQDRSFANVRTKNAYFHWAGLAKGLDIQVGQFKNPFSFENPYTASKLEVPERAAVIGQFVALYDRGIKLLGKDGSLGYQIALVNGSGESRWDENRHKDITARATYTFPALTVGASIYRGKALKDKITDVRKNRHGFDLEKDWADGHFRTEYIEGKDDTIKKKGWYALVRQKIAPSLDIVGRYQEFDPNTSVSGAAAQAAKAEKMKSTTLGFLKYLDKSTTLGFWYEWNQEEVTRVDNNVFTSQVQVQF